MARHQSRARLRDVCRLDPRAGGCRERSLTMTTQETGRKGAEMGKKLLRPRLAS